MINCRITKILAEILQKLLNWMLKTQYSIITEGVATKIWENINNQFKISKKH